MTTPRLPSPSGARLAGDDYQHAFTLLYALKLVFANGNVTKVEMEVDGAGNVDDLIVHGSDAPTLYNQIKFVTSQKQPLEHTWFTTPPKKGQETPLRRFYDSYLRLTLPDGTRPEMALQTNRWPAAGDPLLACVGGANGKLVPRLSLEKPGSKAGQIRREWAEHLGISEEELLAFLEHLAIRAGRDALDELEDKCGLAMRAAGYCDDAASLLAAVGALRKLIEGGTRELDANAVRAICAELNLLAGPPRATLLVQALASDPWPESATASVDWVDLFDGEERSVRRQLRDPDGWNARLKSELVEAVEQIRRAKMKDVHVLGAMRLSTGLLVGQLLSEVAGFVVSVNGREGEWSSSSPKHEFALERDTIEIGTGDEIAVAISISQPIKDDVLAYIEEEQLPVASLHVYRPVGGASREAIPTPEHGAGAAAAISSALREDNGRHRGLLHLFIAAPLPLAVLVGHLWNRMPKTQLYEDLGAGGGYFPSFTV
jgi:SMODS-associated and fused to various effectors sensor domain